MRYFKDKIEKGYGIGFTLPAVTSYQIKKIADNNKSMPPKSTWFEPKLLDGLISMPIIWFQKKIYFFLTRMDIL